MKILVADDDAISRSVMRRLLVQGGYEVLTASTGTEAIERLREENGPRLVLLDWIMPGMDGPDVCRAIRTGLRGGYTYITLLTSRDSKEDLVAGLEAGADDYLTKPCNSEELRARLRAGERVLALEDGLVQAREKMRFQATHDSLTALLNRGASMERLQAALRSLEQNRTEFALVLCDVDFFKKINDQYGHGVGDEVLCEVARRLKRAVRKSDVVGRFGGEEFLILVEDCTCDVFSSHAERICDLIRATPFETTAGSLQVTISVGIVHVGRQTPSRDAMTMLQEADVALYEAKLAGRDRVVSVRRRSNLLSMA